MRTAAKFVLALGLLTAALCTAAQNTVTALGPRIVTTSQYGAVSGPVTALVFSGSTVYAGTPSGIWQSTTPLATAITLTPITDALAAPHAIRSLSLGSNNTTLLAGTGDDLTPGSGILRSTDAGATWTNIPGSTSGFTFAPNSVAALAWSTSTRIVAAVTTSAQAEALNLHTTLSVRGLYVSNNAGLTWQLATLKDSTQTIQSSTSTYLAYHGLSATAVVWNPIRQLFYAAVANHGMYQSADGSTWTRLTAQPTTELSTVTCPPNPNAPGADTCPLQRAELAVDTTTGDTFALLIAPANRSLGLWRLTASATAWTQISTATLESSNSIPNALDALTLAATHSGTDTVIFLGAQDLYRCSLAAGCVWRNLTNTHNGCNAPAHVAPSQRAIAINGSNLFLGNEGGLWRSTDLATQTGEACSLNDASHFTNLNTAFSTSSATVFSVATHPQNTSTFFAAFGPLGSAATLDGNIWQQLGNGESATTLINSANSVHWYAQNGDGFQIARCTNGTACTAEDFNQPPALSYALIANETAATHPPLLSDPAQPAQLLTAACHVWRGETGLTALGSALNDCPVILLAAAGPASGSGSSVIYAATAGGHLYATTNASSTATWAEITPRTGFVITALAADTTDPTGRTLYAATANTLFRTTSAGATWLNVTGGLTTSIHAILIDPASSKALYLATDSGLLSTANITSCATAACWSVSTTSLPPAPVLSLTLRNRTLYVATRGRGIYSLALTTPVVAKAKLAISPATLSFPLTAAGHTSGTQTITLTNTGDAVATLSALAVPANFQIVSQTCASTLAPASICMLSLAFAPQAAGNFSGALAVTTNATLANTAQLSGTAFDFTLAAAGSTTATIAAGSSAIFAATLQPSSSLAQAVTLACTGAPANSTCSLSPAAATLGSVTNITLTLATQHAATHIAPVVYAVLLLPLFFIAKTKRRIAAALLLVLPLVFNGCGSGLHTGTQTTTPGTPVPNPSTTAGTYTLTLTATSNGLTRATTFTAVVQ